MTTWATTTAERDTIDSLEPEQRINYVFARDWGCGHDLALTIANDHTGNLFNELSEKTFSQ